jgi:hypothetical protein
MLAAISLRDWGMFSPYLVGAGLSALVGSGLVNLFNGGAKTKWTCWGCQLAFTTIAAMFMLSTHGAVSTPDTILPKASSLKNLLSQRLLEDINETLNSASEEVERAREVSSNTAAVGKLQGAIESLRAYTHDTEKDVARFEGVYLRTESRGKLDDIRLLCNKTKRRIIERLETLITKPRVLESELKDIMDEAKALSLEFPVEN